LLNLLGLLSHLSCESIDLLLLLRDLLLLLIDRCLQFLNFFIAHGLALQLRARGRLESATRRWYCPLRHSHGCLYTRCMRTAVPAKLVGIEVQSNYNNIVANWLVVIENTTDVTGYRPGAVPIRDVADSDGTIFVGGSGTNEVTDVSVIKAVDEVLSRRVTDGSVVTAINIVSQGLSANSRVAIALASCIRVIRRESEIANGGIVNAVNICEQRVITQRIILESVGIGIQRETAHRIIEDACIVKYHRVGSNGSILFAGAVEQKRCSANGSIGIPGGVKDQCSAAKAGIKSAARGKLERAPAESAVSSPAS
jgi:hypothetical protein